MKEINKLAPDIRAELAAEELRDREKRDIAIADAVAAARFIFDQRQNSRLARYGVKINRQTHKPAKGKEGEKAARDLRLLNLLPAVERYVHTSIIGESVQSEKILVQSQPEIAKTAATPTQKQTSETAPRVHPENRERVIRKSPTTATTPHPQQEQQGFDSYNYPLTDSAITQRFPACNAEYRGRIVRAALALHDDRINDKTIADAIQAATVKDQRSAALYEKTVPETLAAWLRDADRRKTA